MNWNDANPVFFDFETQSGVELKDVGGRRYAADATTRILTLTALIDGVFHVWIPDYIPAPSPMFPLWAAELGDAPQIEVYHSVKLPDAIRAAANARRTFIAHNAWGFDQFIWRYKVSRPGAIDATGDGIRPLVPFLDSIPVARAAGFSGGLEKLSQSLLGKGKDSGKAILKKFIKMQRSKSSGELFYPIPGPGDIAVICRYNIADVELLRRVWNTLDVEIEADVLATHCRINERGVAVDTELTRKIIAVAGESVSRSASKIAELSKGALTIDNIRSPKAVRAWLASQGLIIRDYTGKDTLRRDIVEQAIANPWMMLEDDVPVEAAKEIAPEVFEILRLRAASLRITSAKAERAEMRICPDKRARDLFTYWTAHPGRWSSAGIQVHNLPRAKQGVPVEKLLALHESNEWRDDLPGSTAAAYDAIAAMLPAGVSVDDALSSLLRPMFVPRANACMLLADYNAIKCRGVAWIAGEDSLLESFRLEVDPYIEMASRVFGIPAADVNSYQRQIGKVIVLGSGYGMGVEKFRLFCGLSGVDLGAAGTTAEICVEAYRQAFPAIAGRYSGAINGRAFRRGGVWDQLGAAVLNAVGIGGVHHAGKCSFVMSGTTLVCELPSGRKLRYNNARIEDRVPGYALALGLDKTKATVVYDGLRGPTVLYGGKITENVVQAICRDLLAAALVNLEAAGFNIVLHVHDEAVAEINVEDAATRIEEYCRIMATPPQWAAGFPIKVEGFAAPRFLKKPPAGFAKATAKG